MRPPAEPAGDPVAATDRWLVAQGLPYFVPAERRLARRALEPRRAVPLVLVTATLAGASGVALAWLSGQVALAPAFALNLGMVAVLTYALTALRARPILGWALSRAFGGLRTLLPMMSRALPLLLLFVTFLFINAEVWELSASLPFGTLWLTVLVFVLMAFGFLLVRLPEEVDEIDDAVDDAFLVRGCAGTPLAEEARRLTADQDADPAAYAQMHGYERWNLVWVLLVIQAVQVLLLSMTVFAFFLLFGALVMSVDVQAGWTGMDPAAFREEVLGQFSLPLVKVSLFLASFSALYLTVNTVTDEAYRAQFFGSVTDEMERAVAVRAVYRALTTAEPDGR